MRGMTLQNSNSNTNHYTISTSGQQMLDQTANRRCLPLFDAGAPTGGDSSSTASEILSFLRWNLRPQEKRSLTRQGLN